MLNYHKNHKISDTWKFAVIWTRSLLVRVMHPKDTEGTANSVDPDQTAPLGAVWSGSALFAQTCLSKNLGTLWRTNLEIQEHSMLYKLSPYAYRSIRNKYDPVIKMVKVNPRSSFEKKAPGHGHTTTWYKFWQHFKAFIIPIVLYQFQKDPFWLLPYFIWYFVLFHTCI